jgi:hypothetical protein
MTCCNGRIVATARFSVDAAADGNGAWIVSTHRARLFSRNEAITALTLDERLVAGYRDDDPTGRRHQSRPRFADRRGPAGPDPDSPEPGVRAG